MKWLEFVELFANTNHLDWTASNCPHRQSSTPARIAVDTRQDNTRQAYAFVEVLCDSHCVLTCHGIGHKQNFVRFADATDCGNLIHQHLIDVKSARCIEDHYIITAKTSRLHRAFRNIDRLLSIDDWQRHDFGLFTQDC